MKLITDIDPLTSNIPLSRAGEFDTITKQFSDQCALTVRQRDGLLRLLYQSYLAGDSDREAEIDCTDSYNEGYEDGREEGYEDGYNDGSANA